MFVVIYIKSTQNKILINILHRFSCEFIFLRLNQVSVFLKLLMKWWLFLVYFPIPLRFLYEKPKFLKGDLKLVALVF